MKLKHWNKETFVKTEKSPDMDYTAGYCSVCHADMAIISGKVRHYNSHKIAKGHGLQVVSK